MTAPHHGINDLRIRCDFDHPNLHSYELKLDQLLGEYREYSSLGRFYPSSLHFYYPSSIDLVSTLSEISRVH